MDALAKFFAKNLERDELHTSIKKTHYIYIKFETE